MNDATEYVFREIEGASGAPLLFVLHGTGGDEFQFIELAQHLVPGAHIISPRGDVSELGALRFFRRTGEGVYDMADLERRTGKLARFIAAHRKRLASTSVLAFGYSNGANILASVLFAEPTLVDRAALLHPLIPFTPSAQPQLAGRKVLMTAGRRDPICPPSATEALERYFADQHAEVETVWHEGGHELRQPELEAAARFFAK
jgi:phospholipase/carboxylesterase